jgi:hypothetical protein
MTALGSLVLMLLLAAGPTLVVRDEPAKDPWWERAAVQPRAVAVHGVPVKRLHPDWCAAEAFSREFFGAERLQTPPLDALTFALEGRFDGGAKTQLAFVGAYRRCAGEQGLFVAIVEPAAQRPRVRFLVEVPDAPSAIAHLTREPDGTLAVWWCADCPEGSRIAFNREARGFFVAGPAVPRR